MSMQGRRDYTVEMAVPEGYVVTPATSVPVGAQTLSSVGFESGSAPWVVTNGAFGFGTVGGGSGHNSATTASLYRTSAGQMSIGATFSGLAVGRTYAITAWVKLPSGSSVTAAKAGVTGIGYGSAVNPASTWAQISYTFTATAASHQFLIEATSPGGSAHALYIDDITITANAWNQPVPPVMSYALPLTLLEGTAKLDEGWAPYAQFDLTVALPEKDEWTALVDPRLNRRITVTASEVWARWDEPLPDDFTGTYTFDLSLRDRTLDLNQRTISLALASDEALLQDWTRVATTTDTSARQYQTSVRSIINNSVLSKIGATLEPGTADADFTTLTSLTNQITNPSAQVDLTDVGGVRLTSVVRQTGLAGTAHGTGIRLNGWASSSDSFVQFGGDESALRMGMRAGGTYTASAIFKQDGAQAGTAFGGGRERAIVIVVTRPTGAAVLATSPQAPNTAVTTRLSVTFTVPADATGVALRLYHGHAGTGSLYWTDVLLVEGAGKDTDTITPLAFFDGDTATTSFYTYAWSGTAGKSSSSRTPRYSRDPQTLDWQPGENAYDFIWPVLDTVGLRLFCDENRTWRLVDASYSIPERVSLAGDLPLDNVYTAQDSISKTAKAEDGSLLSYQAVIVKYTWTDSNGNSQVAYDVAGPNGALARVVEWDRPYMGPGMAAYILSRAVGKGRTLDITARRDLSVRPGMEAMATLPNTPIQTGRVRSVEWDLGADTMQVGTAGLTDTPASAWVFLDEGESWNDSPVGASWVSETV